MHAKRGMEVVIRDHNRKERSTTRDEKKEREQRMANMLSLEAIQRFHTLEQLQLNIINTLRGRR